MFRDTLGKVMFNTGRNYLKLAKRARILHSLSNSEKSIPRNSKPETLPSKKIFRIIIFKYFKYFIDKLH